MVLYEAICEEPFYHFRSVESPKLELEDQIKRVLLFLNFSVVNVEVQRRFLGLVWLIWF